MDNIAPIEDQEVARFLAAYKKQDFDEVDELVAAFSQGQKNRALYAVMGEEDKALVETLIEAGADPNTRGDAGNTPLHLAAIYADYESMAALIELGAKPSANNYGDTPLHNCAAFEACAALLLAKFPEIAGQKTNEGLAPIFKSTHETFPLFAKALGTAIDVNATHPDGRSLLWFAAPGWVGTLLLLGAKPYPDVLLRARTLASADVIALIHAGANVHAVGPTFGDTPLHIAARWGRFTHCRVLLAAGASVTAKNKNGATPMHIAVAEKQLQVLELLRGAVNTPGKWGETPLHEAVRLLPDETVCRVDILAKLIKLGADVNAQDDHGYTPLHTAAGHHDVAAVELLLESGAVNIKSHGEHTALDFAKMRPMFGKKGEDVEARRAKVIAMLENPERPLEKAK